MKHTGLSAAEVQQRMAAGQSNNYEAHVGRTYWDIFRDNILNIFNIVLFPLLGIIIAFQQYAVAFFSGFSVVTNALLGTVQEVIAKRRLDKLAELEEKAVHVIRDGQTVEIPVKAVVLDDVLPIRPGDRLVVDGRVLESDALEMDESHLTGESDAIIKEADDDLYSGSFCIAGSGLMVATKVGKNSTINKLSSAAKVYKNNRTPTQLRVDAIVQISILLMLIFAPMLYLADTLNNVELLERVKNLVVFVTSIVPYGMVLVVIISLSLGAISITRHRTLIRRVNAVESLANATVLCFDKTGTLTKNKLAVTEIRPLNGIPIDEIKSRLRLYTDNLSNLNSTAAAVSRYVQESPALAGSKVREIPFNSARKWGALVLKDETLVLGAPERVLGGNNSSDIKEQVQSLTQRGLRVITFARASEAPEGNQLNGDAEPLALVILSDQIREDIRDTLQAFRDQDVTLKVISGDNIETVKSIAAQSGLDVQRAYTGEQLEAMTPGEMAIAASEGNVFARIEPDTKRKIVSALKSRGEHVAMVGDGVNDVPALKEADLAIVMNDGAAITKEIGDIILLDNAMSTLPLAFAEGKEITQTIFGTVKLFLVKTFYNVLLFIYVGFMALPFPITPIQINWVTFGTVNIVATLIAFKILRPAHMENFRRDVLDFVVNGAIIGSVSIAILYAAVYFATGQNTDAARSALSIFVILFGTLIMWNVAGIDIFSPRTFIEHRVIFALGFVLMTMTIVGFYVMPDLFEFVAPPPVLVPQSPLEWTIPLIVSLFILSMLLYSWSMRTRQITKSLWTLFAP
ncbi:MAG: cation-translocating P-type ATPase [Anaerolineae bacterium]|nr:cation-translocating P-type ATPase [Anaerolineae bacterium]